MCVAFSPPVTPPAGVELGADCAAALSSGGAWRFEFAPADVAALRPRVKHMALIQCALLCLRC